MNRICQKGVTLLEALIAVGLLAALVTFLTPSLYNTLRVSTSIIRNGETRESDRIVSEAFAQILSNAVIMHDRNVALRLNGNATSLEVISLAGGSIARQFSLRIENGRLLGEVSSIYGSDVPLQTTEILNYGALRFEYFGRVTENAPLSWTNNWNNATPPKMVRFERSLGSEPKSTIVFDFAVSTRGPINCEFDTVSRQCRP